MMFSVSVLTTAPAAADVNNFRITSYDIRYMLDADSENRSTLKTTETITAHFLHPNQNHGIERAIPRAYDKHQTRLKIVRVVDENNQKLPYSTYTSGDNTVIRIGDPDTYVQGLKTYTITYTQHDVTRYFPDTKSDEFYWDTNGTEWKVPIDELHITLTVDEDLASRLTDNTACYIGSRGSDTHCDLTQAKNIFTTQASNLQPGESITLAVGFQAQTFTEYQKTFFEQAKSVWLFALIASIVVGPIILIILAMRYKAWSLRTKELGSIVTEFIPPKATSVTTSAHVLGNSTNPFAAQLLDFAVRHYIKIIETKPKSFWKSAEYDIEVTKDITALLPEEQEILQDIFGKTPTVGETISLKSLQNNYQFARRLTDNSGKMRKLVRHSYNIRHKNTTQRAWFKKIGFILLGGAIILVNPVLLICAVVTFAYSYALWPLTDKGLALRKYMLGLKEYIKVAETDRLALLQSPEGAEKVGAINTADTGAVVKLYEKVLPYAVLFGLEKEWNKQLGQYYQESQSSPDWYSSHTAFNSAVFASSIHHFASSINTYGGSSSSSSGGSSGGGFSGGGGGGGGGGGW